MDPRTTWAESAWRDRLRQRGQRDRRRRFVTVAVALLILGSVVCGIRFRLLPIGTLLTVQSVELLGNRAIPADEVLQAAKVAEGQAWWSVHPEEIGRRITVQPRIASARVSYAWFHRLCIEVVEHEAALTVLGRRSGEITEDGWFLPARASFEDADLPVLRLDRDDAPAFGTAATEDAAAVAKMVARLCRERPGLWREISEIELRDGEGFAYLRYHRAMIRFIPGLHEDLWLNVPAVLEDLDERDRTDAVLDLRFRGRIVVHLPEAPSADTLVTRAPRKQV